MIKKWVAAKEKEQVYKVIYFKILLLRNISIISFTLNTRVPHCYILKRLESGSV